MVIFAGFVVYLIWGFVFDFIMEAQSKLDIVKVRIRSKQDEIHSVENEINDYEKKINDLKMNVDKHDIEINKLKDIINGTIIQPKEVKEALSQFMVGWYNWLSHGRVYSRSEHNKVYEEFIQQNITVLESIITPN
jgi:chromosome segregation ATPase